MRLKAEVVSRFDHAGDANRLLYAPLAAGLTSRETRCYLVEFDGAEAACRRFLQRVLADETSHALHIGETPALDGFSFLLDFGMKPGALDLEKETILGYFRGLEQPDFTLKTLKIQRRIYVFGAEAAEIPAIAERFVKDIVNPAIHHHSVVAA
ncbi:MAG: hypothetical protein KA004_16200 [Verrucomicrobiales bacterium]|nr:hypothetical protein [Verrucomicrobiales bacterium]